MREVALAAVSVLLFAVVARAQDAGPPDAAPANEAVNLSTEIVREYPPAPSDPITTSAAPSVTSAPEVPYPYAPGHGAGGLLGSRSNSVAREPHTTIQSGAALGAGVIMTIIAFPAAIVGTLMMVRGSPQVGCTAS